VTISERIQKTFHTGRFNTLLLEVFAIFLGITASFAVEEWREQQQEQEDFERYLQAVYYDALREEARMRRFIFRNAQAVAAIDSLLKRDMEEMSDIELLSLAGRVFSSWSLPRGDTAFRALQNSGIPVPFDDTMQVLNTSYELTANARSQLDTQIAEHNRMVDRVRSDYGTVSNPTMSIRNEDRSVIEGNRFDQYYYESLRELFFSDGRFLPMEEGILIAREALPREDARRMLSQDMVRTMQSMDLAISLADAAYAIRETIREKLPGLRLDIRELSLVGDATPTGWTEIRGLPLKREGSNSDWWSAEVELEQGAIKFVANQAWGTSWGAPIAWAHVDPLVNDRAFTGDPDSVFPRAVAEFDGMNIPVEAGRWKVRFNTHTFEYIFTLLNE
jgi:hypothetical protein